MSALKSVADVAWELVQIIGPATILSWFGIKAVRERALTKAEAQQAADALATRAVAYASNWARDQLRKRKSPVPPSQIIDTAVQFFRDHAIAGMGKWSRDTIEKWIAAAYERQRKNGKAPRKALVIDPDTTPTPPELPIARR